MDAWPVIALAGAMVVPSPDGARDVAITLRPGDGAWRGSSRAAAVVALERADAWAGRELVCEGAPSLGAGVLGLDLLRVGLPFPEDVGVVGEFLPDGRLAPDPAAPIGAWVARGRVRLVVSPEQAGAVRAAGGEPVVARWLAEASAAVAGRPWAPPREPPPLAEVVAREVAAELRQARGRVGPRASWELPEPVADELTARLQRVRGPASWWASLEAEAVPYAWALSVRAMGPEPEPGVALRGLAAAMDGRLERHLAGPADAVPAARALLGHGLVMSRALAACEAVADPGGDLDALMALAEAQARAELASLYVTDTMITRAEALAEREVAPAARLLAAAALEDADGGCVGSITRRLAAADLGRAWTAVDASLGLGWALAARGGPPGGAREAAARAVAEAVEAGLPMDAERLELAGARDLDGLRELAVRARVARLVLQPR